MLLAAALFAEACGAGWRQPSEISPGPLSPRQQVQVWRQGTVVRWHAVVLTPDTVSGIPFNRPIDCASCRLGFPRSSVDSLRLGDPVAGVWKSVGLAIGALIAACLAVCPRGMS